MSWWLVLARFESRTSQSERSEVPSTPDYLLSKASEHYSSAESSVDACYEMSESPFRLAPPKSSPYPTDGDVSSECVAAPLARPESVTDFVATGDVMGDEENPPLGMVEHSMPEPQFGDMRRRNRSRSVNEKGYAFDGHRSLKLHVSGRRHRLWKAKTTSARLRCTERGLKDAVDHDLVTISRVASSTIDLSTPDVLHSAMLAPSMMHRKCVPSSREKTRNQQGPRYIGRDERVTAVELLRADGSVLDCVPPVFVELDILTSHTQGSPQAPTDVEFEWLEAARWVRYEEDVDPATGSFGQAHSPPLAFHAVVECRRYLEQGAIVLNCESPPQSSPPLASETHPDTHHPHHILMTQVNLALDALRQDCGARESDVRLLQRVLNLRHQHVCDVQQSATSTRLRRCDLARYGGLQTLLKKNHSNLEPPPGANADFVDCRKRCKSVPSMHGGLSFVRRTSTTVNVASTNNSFGQAPCVECGHWGIHASDLEGRLSPSTEIVSVQVGVLSGLAHPLLAFIRLSRALHASDLTELHNSHPIRFVILFLGPERCHLDYVEVGRVLATMMVDKHFRGVAYSASSRDHLLRGLRQFLETTVVLPMLSEITPRSLLAMHQQVRRVHMHLEKRRGDGHTSSVPSLLEAAAAMRRKRYLPMTPAASTNREQDALHERPTPNAEREVISEPSKSPTTTVQHPSKSDDHEPRNLPSPSGNEDNPCCSHLRAPKFTHLGMALYTDLVAFKNRFSSDFMDPFRTASTDWALLLSTVVFVYFVVLAPAITFGALLESSVSPQFTIPLCIFASGASQCLFSLVGGQPLLIVGMTGPMLILETCIKLLCEVNKLPLPLMRLHVAMYTSLFGLILVLLNAGRLVVRVRRSLEEVFNFFVSFYFIFKALKNLCDGFYPKTSELEVVPKERDTARLVATILLSVLMLTVCLWLQAIKRGRYFRRKIRNLFGYFNVPIGLMCTICVNRILFPKIHAPTVHVPATNPNSSVLSTLVMIPMPTTGFGVNAHALAAMMALCLVPAIATETVLSGISVAKSERRLRKPCLFSLDLLITLCVLPLSSAVFGWPFLCPASVRSNSHVIALTKWNTRTPPGVPHKIVGCMEQRITGLAIGLLVAASIALESRLFAFIPMGALYGMFLYMGIMGLRDLILVRRVLALLKRQKHWQDQEYLRHLPWSSLAVFVCTQCVCIAVLLALNWTTEFARVGHTSIVFPFVLLLFAVTRERILPRLRVLTCYIDQMDKLHKLRLPKLIHPPCCPTDHIEGDVHFTSPGTENATKRPAYWCFHRPAIGLTKSTSVITSPVDSERNATAMPRNAAYRVRGYSISSSSSTTEDVEARMNNPYCLD